MYVPTRLAANTAMATKRLYLSPARRFELAQTQRFKCYSCQASLINNETRQLIMDVDHKVALCNGGTNDRSNLTCLCLRCHRLKTREDNNLRRLTRALEQGKYTGPVTPATCGCSTAQAFIAMLDQFRY